MTDTYVFQAALWCDECILGFKEEVEMPEGIDPRDESTYDSDHWPKGPYSDGGGEADAPSHCEGCGTFLENELTDEGVKYVVQACLDDLRLISQGAENLEEGSIPLTMWLPFYSGIYDEITRLYFAIQKVAGLF